jgi:hypothetical protein
VVNNLAGTSSSTDAGNAYSESTPVVGGGSEFSSSSNTEDTFAPVAVPEADILTNYQASTNAGEGNQSFQTVSNFLAGASGGSFDQSFLNGVDSESLNTFAGLINEYAQTGSSFGSGSNQPTDSYLSQLQGDGIIGTSSTFDTNQSGGSSLFA